MEDESCKVECLKEDICRIDEFVFLFKRKKLPRYFFTNMIKTFEYIDVSKDGQISAKDIHTALNVPLYRAQDIVACLDMDHNGIFDYGEFCLKANKLKALLLGIGQDPSESRNKHVALVNAFRVFDRGQNGLINPAYFRRVLMNCGEPMTEEEFEDFITQAPKTPEGYIYYHSFLSYLENPCHHQKKKSSTPKVSRSPISRRQIDKPARDEESPQPAPFSPCIKSKAIKKKSYVENLPEKTKSIRNKSYDRNLQKCGLRRKSKEAPKEEEEAPNKVLIESKVDENRQKCRLRLKSKDVPKEEEAPSKVLMKSITLMESKVDGKYVDEKVKSVVQTTYSAGSLRGDEEKHHYENVRSKYGLPLIPEGTMKGEREKSQYEEVGNKEATLSEQRGEEMDRTMSPQIERGASLFSRKSVHATYSSSKLPTQRPRYENVAPYEEDEAKPAIFLKEMGIEPEGTQSQQDASGVYRKSLRSPYPSMDKKRREDSEKHRSENIILSSEEEVEEEIFPETTRKSDGSESRKSGQDASLIYKSSKPEKHRYKNIILSEEVEDKLMSTEGEREHKKEIAASPILSYVSNIYDKIKSAVMVVYSKNDEVPKVTEERQNGSAPLKRNQQASRYEGIKDFSLEKEDRKSMMNRNESIVKESFTENMDNKDDIDLKSEKDQMISKDECSENGKILNNSSPSTRSLKSDSPAQVNGKGASIKRDEYNAESKSSLSLLDADKSKRSNTETIFGGEDVTGMRQNLVIYRGQTSTDSEGMTTPRKGLSEAIKKFSYTPTHLYGGRNTLGTERGELHKSVYESFRHPLGREGELGHCVDPDTRGPGSWHVCQAHDESIPLSKSGRGASRKRKRHRGNGSQPGFCNLLAQRQPFTTDQRQVVALTRTPLMATSSPMFEALEAFQNGRPNSSSLNRITSGEESKSFFSFMHSILLIIYSFFEKLLLVERLYPYPNYMNAIGEK